MPALTLLLVPYTGNARSTSDFCDVHVQDGHCSLYVRLCRCHFRQRAAQLISKIVAVHDNALLERTAGDAYASQRTLHPHRLILAETKRKQSNSDDIDRLNSNAYLQEINIYGAAVSIGQANLCLRPRDHH